MPTRPTSAVFLHVDEVVERTSLHRRAIYRMASAGRFPKPVKLSERHLRWIASEVDKWLEERIVARSAA